MISAWVLKQIWTDEHTRIHTRGKRENIIRMETSRNVFTKAGNDVIRLDVGEA